MKSRFFVISIVFLNFFSLVIADEPSSAQISHTDFQAVDSYGEGVYVATDKVVLEGVVLNRPEDMLDWRANYFDEPGTWAMGAEWQFYFQGEGQDHAGTAVWMGQNYHNSTIPNAQGYDNQAWLDELLRLNPDPNNTYTLLPGDRIRVEGFYKFFRGKMNINEQHSADPNLDFTIELLERGGGVPLPDVVSLDELKDSDDNFIFDPTRQSGCEYYQGRMIRINNVRLCGPQGPSDPFDPDDWYPNSDVITVTDGTKSFPVKIGLGEGIFSNSYVKLNDSFDIIAIMDQEDSSDPYKSGYRLWICSYDGNPYVLADRSIFRQVLPADINIDGAVNAADFALLAMEWLEQWQ